MVLNGKEHIGGEAKGGVGMLTAKEVVRDNGPLGRDGAALSCRRCGTTWVYRGGKLEEAKAGNWPVYTSCPNCQLSAVQIKPDRLVPAGKRYSEVYA